MTRRIAVLIAALSALAAVPTFAQEVSPGPGTLEVTVIPGGATFFTSKGTGPEFGNYTYGGALTYNVTKYVGLEGEVGGSAGVAQDLKFATATVNQRTPNSLTYNGNIVVAAAGYSLVPFVTGGIGGLTEFERPELGVKDMTTFLTGNVGGGLKWYAPKGRWGLRGDYRFIAVRSNDTASSFFGQETRYGHRVYGGVIVNALR